MSYGEPLPIEWWWWKLARETGWTLEYIKDLSQGDWMDYWRVLDGEGKAAEQRHKSGGRKR